MSNKSRVIVPEVIYHVTSKGVFGVDIFPGNELKTFFKEELAKTLKQFSYLCYGWSIMNDHYHLVLKSGDIPISAFMQRLNSVYAKHFNRVSGRKGVVFYRRFASVIVQEESGLKDLVRYVHRNPVRAGCCSLEELDNYEWSGHGAVINTLPNHFQDINKLLRHFPGSHPDRIYLNFIRSEPLACSPDTLIQKIRNANQGRQNFSKPEFWIIGEPEFIISVIQKDQCRHSRIARHISEGIHLEKLMEKVCVCMDINKEDFFRQGRFNPRSRARELFVFVGTTRFDFSARHLAHYLGITGSAVSRMVSRSGTVKNRDSFVAEICQAASSR